ncbi:xylose isomerase-like protein, partial [Cutaneotrichosporon oleaginosum]
IASLSLGSSSIHPMERKLAAAATAGFDSVEIFDQDWDAWKNSYASDLGLAESAHGGQAIDIAAAKSLRALAASYGLRISCWQPLRQFEGWANPAKREASRKHAAGVLSLLPHLGTDLLLVCSTTALAPHSTSDFATAVEDLAWLADQGARYDPPIRVMYEGLSFGTHRRRWQDVWAVVRAASRPNLGICLDSFNTLALEWADPYAADGRRAATGSVDVDAALEANMKELVATVPGDKIFLVQVADGQFMNGTLSPPTDPSVPRLLPWSRGHRLFPLEETRGAYLPVIQFCRAVMRTGYTGPWSLEVFNTTLSSVRPETCLEHAKRGYTGLKRIVEIL